MTTVSDRPAGPDIRSVLLNPDERPDPPRALSTSMSFTWRVVLKIKHIPEQLIDVTMFPILFTLMFTYLFGGALAGSTGAYLQVLLPGIIVQTVVMITMYTGVTLNRDMEKGVFDRFRSLPIWRPAPLVGALGGDVVRYSITITITMALGLILGFRPHGGILGVLSAIALLLIFAFSISWIWTMCALLLRSEQAVMAISFVVLFPLTFASNIFVDPATMPGWLEAFANANPISQLVTAMRGLMQGEVAIDVIATVLGWSALLVAIFGPITMRLYNRKS